MKAPMAAALVCLSFVSGCGGNATRDAAPARMSLDELQARYPDTSPDKLARAFKRADEPADANETAKPGADVPIPEDLNERFHEKYRKKVATGGKSPYDKPAEAVNFFLEQRTGGEPLDYQTLARAKQYVAADMPHAVMTSDGLRIVSSEAAAIKTRGVADIESWEELGPGNIGGRTRAIMVDPANPNVMFVGGVAGGVWKTTNGGAGWTPLDDLMDNLAVTTLTFEGDGAGGYNTNVIYAGTGEGFFNSDAVRGAGLFKSTDGGATWTPLATTANSNFHYVNKLIADTGAARAGTLYAATRTGVWMSDDGGASWSVSLSDNGLGGTNGTEVNTTLGITDIEQAGDTLICSNGSFATDGIYRSADAGATWTRVHTAAGLGRSDLAIAPSDPNVMYALSADNGNGHRLLQVYRSDDNGATWTGIVQGAFSAADDNWLLLSNPPYAQCFCTQQTFSQGWYDNIIAVAPHDPDIVFAGGVDLFRGEVARDQEEVITGIDFGVISYWWTNPAGSTYAHADHHTIVFDPNWDGVENQTMYTGNDGGIQRTDNALAATGDICISGFCGASAATPSSVAWTNLNNGYGVTQFYHGRPLPGGADYFGGTQDNGTLYGDDVNGPGAWGELFGGDGGYVAYDPDAPTTLFLETTQLSIQRSYLGTSFTSIVSGIGESSGNFLFINPFRMDPSNRDRIWTGGIFAWRSSNASAEPSAGAVAWTQAGEITPGTGSISAWAIDPNNSDRVWVGLSDGWVEMTTEGTTSDDMTVWPDVINGTTDWSGSGYTSWIEVDGNDATGQTVYVTNSRFGASKILRTGDMGATWTDITNNLPDVPVHCIRVQPGEPSNLFIGTDLGVFVSTNTGAAWASMNDVSGAGDFANVVVETLEFTDAAALYAFTHGRGAWRASVGTVDAAFSPVYVDGGHAGPFEGTESNPVAMISDALGIVTDGGEIIISGNQNYSESPLNVSQSVTLTAVDGSVTVD